MADKFSDLYRRFEDEFRGSTGLIRSRLEAYLPLVNQLPSDLRETTVALDLGCGRGEWLRLMAEGGWRAVGVDAHGSVMEPASEAGISVHQSDALDYLRAQPSDSVGILSAFHMAEHVTPDYLVGLLREGHRVLAPNGLLILETPNPENLAMATWSFHLDPTHLRPLPPMLLRFLLEQMGFRDVGIVRLNDAGVKREQLGTLAQSAFSLFTQSGDVAALGLKGGPGSGSGIISAFAQRMSKESELGGLVRAFGAVDSIVDGDALGQLRQNVDDLRRIAVASRRQNDETAASIAELTRVQESSKAALAHVRQRLKSLEKANRKVTEAHRQVVEEFRSPGAGMELSVGLWLARRLRPLGRLARAVSPGGSPKRKGAAKQGHNAPDNGKARQPPAAKPTVEAQRATDLILKPTREAARAWESILAESPKARRP